MPRFERVCRKLKICKDIIKANTNVSYAQFGEDIIVDKLFTYVLRRDMKTFLEIGTNHPIIGNNTYLFYLKGIHGYCIEPDPELFNAIIKVRPKDKILNVGVGISDDIVEDLFVFPKEYTGWNTFSLKEATERVKETGINYVSRTPIKMYTINTIIKSMAITPDFISLDIEGLDLLVLRTIDFENFRPLVFCVETRTYVSKGASEKLLAIIEFMETQRYKIYADTFYNTIFLREDIYNSI